MFIFVGPYDLIQIITFKTMLLLCLFWKRDLIWLFIEHTLCLLCHRDLIWFFMLSFSTKAHIWGDENHYKWLPFNLSPFFFFNISAYSNTKGFLCSFMLFLFLKGVTNTQKLPCACLCLDKKWDQNKERILMLLHINLHVLIPSKPLLLLPPLCVYGLVT